MKISFKNREIQMKRTESISRANGLSTKSRYYIDPMAEHGEVKIIKPVDKKLLEKNRVLLHQSKKDAERRKKLFINSVSGDTLRNIVDRQREIINS